MDVHLIVTVIHAGLISWGIPYAVFVLWDEDLKL